MRALLACVGALALALAGACSDDASTRFALQARAGTVGMGPDERITARLVPGRAVEVADKTTFFDLTMRASAPFPTVYLDNGTVDARQIELTLNNIDPDANAFPRLRRLPSDARRDPRCGDNQETDVADVLLAPIDVRPNADEPKTARLTLVVPPCRTLSVSLSLPRETPEYRVAVFGSAGGSTEFVQDALDAARAVDADYAHLLGGLATRSRVAPFGDIAAIADTSPIPVGASPAPSDLRAGATGYIDSWGQTDFTTRIGWTRLLVLDTAERRLSAEQFNLLDEIAVSRQPGFALFTVPPFDLGGLDDDGFRSSQQADRLYTRLVRRGFRDVVSSLGGSWISRTFGDLHLYDTGGARTASDDRHMVLIRLTRPWPDLVACVYDVDCSADEFCNLGFCRERCDSDTDCSSATTRCDNSSSTCRITCDTDDDCPAPAPECGSDGFCDLEPAIIVERLFY
jgi:hypothetical protein